MDSVSSIVSQTIYCQEEKAKYLAEAVLQKTQAWMQANLQKFLLISKGNPFFVIQLLKTLYTEDIIQYDINTGDWTYNLEVSQFISFVS